MYRSLLFCVLLLPSLGFGQIFEITFYIKDLDCPYCHKAILTQLEKVPGIAQCTIFDKEGSIHIEWSGELPFQSSQFFKLLRQEDYCLKTIEIDLEGQIEEKKKALILYSEPDTSFFFIDRQSPGVSQLRTGDLIRVRGEVTQEHGNNILTVKEIIQ
jgi:copper chaperone CopZ